MVIQSLGSRMREERKKQGLTLEQFGQKIGISGSLVGRYERDEENPKPETIKKFADALGVSANWLIYGDGDPDQQSFFDDVAELREALRRGKGFSENSAERILDGFQSLIDDALSDADCQELFRLYQSLNREGQRVALERLDELAQLPKYQRQPAQEGQQTEQSTPGGAEDKTDQA